MIPRYQKILFLSLLGAILLMASFLFYERKKAHERLAEAGDQTPIAAPTAADTEAVTLALADDNTGAVTQVQRQYALPQEPTVRARALLERLLEEYALPKSPHPIAAGAAVDDVFLLNLPLGSTNGTPNAGGSAGVSDFTSTSAMGPAGQLAVINLRGSFLEGHPSGIGVETLTLVSIIETLHANFPQVTQVRFLVDGQPRDTIAGHVDLRRVYPADFGDQQMAPAPATDANASGAN